MGRINLGRVVLGGLLAGLVINCSEFVLNMFVLAADMEAALKARNLPMIDNQMIVWFVLLGFAQGILTIWLYSAIRPRFGPGVSTAAWAGVVVWTMAYVFPNVGMGVLQIFPARMEVVATVWGLPEAVIASIAGAWLYTEG